MLRSSLTALVIIWLPLTAWGSQLLSAQSSYHEKGNFALLVLRFDEKTAHRALEMEGRMTAQITLSDCRAQEKAQADLAAVKNALIRKVLVQHSDQALTISLQFSAAARMVVRETENPHSLILDLSPTGTTSRPQQKKDVAPPSSKLKTEAPKTPKKTPPAKPKERNRLADAQKSPTPAPDRKAEEALDSAKAYRQQGDKEGEVQQWDAFFRAVTGAKSTQDSLLERPEIVGETKAISPLEGQGVDLPEPSKQRELKKTTLPLEFLLGAALLLMGAIIIILYLRQRDLNRAIRALLESKEVDTTTRAEDSASHQGRPGIEPGGALQDMGLVNDAAREVLSLYHAGMSISGIAEKLSMGQDEVRLVLNLSREEKTSV